MGKPRIDTSYPGTAGRADTRGWGPGYPNGQGDKMLSLAVAGVSFPAGCRIEVRELASILLEHSIGKGWLDLHPGWCWGYANRAIKPPPGEPPTNIPSNHSWGLALDVNAPENPYGGTTHEIPEEMGRLWNEYGWRWGGDYPNTKDWMHFEFMGTPGEARAMTLAARAELGGDDEVKELEQYEQGQDDYWSALEKNDGVDPGPPPEGWASEHRKKGYKHARKAANNPKATKA